MATQKSIRLPVLTLTLMCFVLTDVSGADVPLDAQSKSNPISPTTSPAVADTRNALNFFEGLLHTSQSHYLALVYSLNGLAPKDCNLHEACTPGRPSTTIPFFNLSNPSTVLPPEADHVQVRNGSANVSTSNAASPLPKVTTNLCAVGAMKPSWRTQFRNGSRGSTAFQYFAGADDSFGNYPARQWNCANDYKPTLRPYYVAGATGQKDVVILVDVSTKDDGSTERIAFARKATISLLRTLSFRDYVAVLLYDDHVDYGISSGTNLLQATSGNIQSLITSVEEQLQPQAFKGKNSTRAALDTALKAAFTLFNRTVGTSRCTKTVVLLTSGRSDTSGDASTASAPVSTYVTHGTGSVMFSFMLMANRTNAAVTEANVPPNVTSGIPARLACVSSGVFRAVNVLNPETDPLDLIDSYNQYFTILLNNPVVRWSEVYEDQFGQGLVTSGALPVYGNMSTPGISLNREGDGSVDPASNVLMGMTVMDIPLGNLTQGGRGQTEKDINSYLLSSQTCTPLRYSDTDAIKAMSHPRPDCGNSLNTGDELALRRFRPLIIVSSVILVLLFSFGPFCLSPERAKKQSLVCGVVPFLVCWIICLSLFWAKVFSDVVVKEDFVEVSYVVDATEANPFRCCDVVNCRCESYYGDSCWAMRSRLEAGPCDDGYYCCWQSCHSCNCHHSKKGGTSCSTCCHCGYSVWNQRCDVVCGTCYRPTAQVSYEFEQQLVRTQFSTLCSRGDVGCKDAFLNKYSIGSVHVGYVNPTDPEEIATSNQYRLQFFVPFMIFAVLSAIPFGLMWVLFFKYRVKAAPKPRVDEVWAAQARYLAGGPSAGPTTSEPSKGLNDEEYNCYGNRKAEKATFGGDSV